MRGAHEDAAPICRSYSRGRRAHMQKVLTRTARPYAEGDPEAAAPYQGARRRDAPSYGRGALGGASLWRSSPSRTAATSPPSAAHARAALPRCSPDSIAYHSIHAAPGSARRCDAAR
jgi:hypothetical protein